MGSLLGTPVPSILRTSMAFLQGSASAAPQWPFSPVAVLASRSTRQGGFVDGAFPRPALLASVKGTPAKKKAPEVAAGARSCARRPAVKYGRGAGAPARRRAQSGSTRRVRSIPPEMSTARAVVSHSPTSTVSPTWFPMGPPAVGTTRMSETRRPWVRLYWRAALSAVTMS